MTTLGEYMHWLRSAGGECRSGHGADPVVGMVPLTKLISPKGKSVIYQGGDQNEVLSTYMVEYLDRRLEMISPFRSVERG